MQKLDIARHRTWIVLLGVLAHANKQWVQHEGQKARLARMDARDDVPGYQGIPDAWQRLHDIVSAEIEEAFPRPIQGRMLELLERLHPATPDDLAVLDLN